MRTSVNISLHAHFRLVWIVREPRAAISSLLGNRGKALPRRAAWGLAGKSPQPRRIASRESLRNLPREHPPDPRAQGAPGRTHRYRRLRRASRRARAAAAGAVPLRVGSLRQPLAAALARQERAQGRAGELGSDGHRSTHPARLPSRTGRRKAEPLPILETTAERLFAAEDLGLAGHCNDCSAGRYAHRVERARPRPWHRHCKTYRGASGIGAFRNTRRQD